MSENDPAKENPNLQTFRGVAKTGLIPRRYESGTIVYHFQLTILNEDGTTANRSVLLKPNYVSKTPIKAGQEVVVIGEAYKKKVRGPRGGSTRIRAESVEILR